jgi:hypothetical protein
MNPLLATVESKAEPEDPLDKLRDPLSRLIDEYVEKETATERAKRYLQIRRVDAYMKGDQFAILTASSATGALDYAGATLSGIGDIGEQSGVYDSNFDIIKGYGRKYHSILGSRPFYNGVAEPRNPSREADRRAARSANTLKTWLTSCWDLPTKNLEFFSRQWDSGEVYGYLQWVADEKMFGKVEVPQYTPRDVMLEPGGFLCRNCGVKSPAPHYLDMLDPMTGMPSQVMSCPACQSEISDGNWEEPVTAVVPEFTGTAKFPQAGPRLTLCTPITVTVSQGCKDSLESTPYLRYEYEEHKGILLNYFGEDLRRLVKNSEQVQGGNTQTNLSGRHARAQETANSGSGLPALQNYWTYTRIWLRPAMYECLTDETLRGELQQDYPLGMKISLVDGAIVRIEHENLSDCWVVGVPEPGKTIQHKPIAYAGLGHQDAINDQGNIMVALLERGLPTYGYRSDLFNAKAFKRKSHLPAEAIPILPTFGGRIEDAIVKFPTATFPDQAMPLAAWIKDNIEQHWGLLPSAWGGSSGGKKTALQVQQELAQALQVLGTPGTFASRFYAQVFDLAVKMVVRRASADIQVSIKSGGLSTADVVDLEALKNGDYEFKCEVGIPMSLAEIQARIDNIISQSPLLAEILFGLDATNKQFRNMSNVGALVDKILPGITDLQIPGKDEWDYTARKIQQLVEEQPIVGPDGMEQPSQQPEEFVPNFATEANNVAQWCRSAAGQTEAERNRLGYRNVVLYGKACWQRAQAPPPSVDQQGGTPPPAEQLGAQANAA